MQYHIITTELTRGTGLRVVMCIPM